jgi:hypothetical protein
VAVVLVSAILSVPTAAAQEQDVREYIGGFTPPEGANVLSNQARFVVSPPGLGADLELRFIGADAAGNCSQYVVDTLQQPEPVDTTTSSPQEVNISVLVTLSGEGNLCDANPFTQTGSLQLVLEENVITGTLFFVQQEFDFRAPLTAGGTSATTTGGNGGDGAATPGLEALAVGGAISRDAIEGLGRIAQCDSPGQRSCDDAIIAGARFSEAILPRINDDRVGTALTQAVIIGTLRTPDGRAVVPSMGHLFPVLLTLGARADAGDEEAVIALQRLVGGLTALAVRAQS